MVSDFIDTVMRHVTDDDAARACRFKVNIVGPDTVTHDDLTAGQLVDYEARNRRELHQDRVGILARINNFLLRLALKRAEFPPSGFDDLLLDRYIGKSIIGNNNSQRIFQKYALARS